MEIKELKKPKVKITGEDGNIFNLIGICSKALNKSNQPQQAKEMTSRVFSAGSYDEALSIIDEYCDLE